MFLLVNGAISLIASSFLCHVHLVEETQIVPNNRIHISKRRDGMMLWMVVMVLCVGVSVVWIGIVIGWCSGWLGV